MVSLHFLTSSCTCIALCFSLITWYRNPCSVPESYETYHRFLPCFGHLLYALWCEALILDGAIFFDFTVEKIDAAHADVTNFYSVFVLI